MKLRYLPTNDELRELTLPPSKRGRKRPVEPVYLEATRILLAKGLNPSTCAIWYCREAYAEAKNRLGPDPLIS
jgi:hypothetical protein